MKACRQIQKEHSILERGLISCKRFGNVIEERCKDCQFKAGWRAALEWVLKDVKETYNDDLSECEFVKHIEDELNEN